MIDSLIGFMDEVNKSHTYSKDGVKFKVFNDGTYEVFCPKCSGIRKFHVKGICGSREYRIGTSGQLECDYLPSMFRAICLQCESEALVLLYNGLEGVELAVLHNTYSGCVTPNSPKEVKYYIDQAYRARSVGAISAAMAMYRSALEWLLYEQGYQKGMLGQKINDLEAAIKSKTAPKWAMELGTEFLKAIKDIGNGAIHTNGGDITKQANLDKELVELVDVVFAELLDKIYEQPLRSSANLAKLKAKAAVVK